MLKKHAGRPNHACHRLIVPTLAALTAGAAFALLPIASSSAAAETLVINTDRSGAGQKEAFNEIVAAFEEANPDVDVTVNYSGVEPYKTAIRNFLVTSPPDIAFWFTGRRMRTFTEPGLFEDISDLFDEAGWKEPMAPFIEAVTDDGKQYMMPTNFNTWGFFYNKQVFADHGIEEPETWSELMAAAETLKAADIVPFTIGTRDLWANALWFDFLTKRMCGLELYMELMEGTASYTHPCLVKVFDTWREPIEKGYFLENASSYGWQEAIPFLAQGRAGMYLLGPYVLTSLPEEMHDNIGFFPFPEVNPEIPTYAQVSINGVGIPSGAENKETAKEFLKFFAQPEHLLAFAQGGAVVPARTDIEVPPEDFASVQMELVRNAAGSSQFYDRDTHPEMAQVGMEGFQEFLAHPERQDEILERLDQARQRIFE